MKIGTLFNYEAGPAESRSRPTPGRTGSEVCDCGHERRMHDDGWDAGGCMADRCSCAAFAQARPTSAELVEATTALARFTGNIGGALKSDALAVLSIKVLPVETVEAASKLADQRAGVKLLLKDIEHRRKSVVEPIKKEAAAVDEEARRWADPLRDWDRKAEQVLLAYQRLDADRKRREELDRQKAAEDAARALGAAEDAGDAIAAEAASVAIMQAEAKPVEAPIRGFKTEAGSQSIRTTWKVEVVDPALVPDAYWTIDLQRLQKAVDAGARDIPGTNIFEHESLTVRTRG